MENYSTRDYGELPIGFSRLNYHDDLPLLWVMMNVFMRWYYGGHASRLANIQWYPRYSDHRPPGMTDSAIKWRLEVLYRLGMVSRRMVEKGWFRYWIYKPSPKFLEVYKYPTDLEMRFPQGVIKYKRIDEGIYKMRKDLGYWEGWKSVIDGQEYDHEG